MTPIILICGAAGSGKDTVATMLASVSDAGLVAQADTIKKFAARVFGFSQESLYGPSDARNAPDPSFDLKTDEGPMHWGDVYEDMDNWANEFAQAYLSHLTRPKYEAAAKAMADWFGQLMAEHGLGLHRDGEQVIISIDNPNAKVLTPRRVLQTFGTEFGRAVDEQLWTNIAVKESYETLRTKSLAIITDGRFRSEILAVKKAGGKVVKIVGVSETKLNDHASETELDTVPTSWFDVVLVNDKSLGLDALQIKVVTELAPGLSLTDTFHIGSR